MKWFFQILSKNKNYQKAIAWTKKYHPIGFEGLSLYTIGMVFIEEIKTSSMVNRAASLSYSFILAIFPTIIFIFTLIPFIPIKGFQDQLLQFTALVLPEDTFNAIESTIFDIVKNQNSKLLSFGFISALFFATNGTHKLMVSFNKSSLVKETRSWLKQRTIAITLTCIVACSLFICIGIMVGGEFALNYVRKSLKIERQLVYFVLQLLRWAIFIFMYLFTISLLYRFGPSHARNWKFFSAGAWLATLLAILTFIGFAYYINNFGRYNKVYGSIGTLIIMMIWMNLNAYILLIGYELNACIELSKRKITYIRPFSNKFRKEN